MAIESHRYKEAQRHDEGNVTKKEAQGVPQSGPELAVLTEPLKVA